MGKKYVSLNKLSIFLDNLKNIFAASIHKHKINDIEDYIVDFQLSSTSENPVQNKVLDAKFNAISEALNIYDIALDDKASKEHVHEISDINELQTTLDEIESGIVTSWNELEDRPFGEVEQEVIETVYENMYAGGEWYPEGSHILNVKKTYRISVFGVDYICETQTASISMAGVEVRWIGNSNLITDSSVLAAFPLITGSESKYQNVPFVIYNYIIETESDSNVLFDLDNSVTKTNGGKIIVGLSLGTENIIYQIDEKFIPDTIARVSVINDLQMNLNELDEELNSLESTIVTSWNDLDDKPFCEEEVPVEKLECNYVCIAGSWDVLTDSFSGNVRGQYRVVMPDGSEYTLKAKSKSQTVPMAGQVTGLKWLGNPTLIEDTGGEDISNETDYIDYPFVIYKAFDMTSGSERYKATVLKFDDSVKGFPSGTEFTVYLQDGTKTIVHQIEEKYIPDTIARTVVTDDLQYSVDRLEDSIITSWNELKDRPFYDEGREKVYITEETEVDFSNGAYFFTNDIYKLNKDSKDIIVSVNGVDYSATAHWNGYPVDAYFIDITNEDCPLCYELGNGFYDTTGNLGSATISLFYYNEIPLKQLDEKYIPDTIARTSDIVQPLQSDWAQTDEIQLDFIKNKPEIATDEDIMDMLSELEMVKPITTSDGSILTSSTGEIYTL